MHLALSQKKILLALTGGIACYKAADLCRQLKKSGAEVRVVMSAGAQAFITPLTLQALSGRPVHTELLDSAAEAGMGHIELAKWPDLILVAPATAHLIARYQQGLADDLLTTLLLATEAPVALAPAMNQAMWRHPATQRNVQDLRALCKVHIWGPAEGEQACGDVGPGRMLEPAELLAQCAAFFAQGEPGVPNEYRSPVLGSALQMQGMRVVITAGPTREAIDPVRYISNHSSGKMGFALAEAFSAAGAQVCLIAGPVSLATPTGVERIDVVSAQEMYDACHLAVARGCDVFVAAAAVADYRLAQVNEHKIKKQKNSANLTLHLTENQDIVASIAALESRPLVVGFAAETQDVLTYARAKLQRKKLDMVIANDVSQPGLGFNSDENEVWVLSTDTGSPEVFEQALGRAEKSALASQIVAAIAQKLKRK